MADVVNSYSKHDKRTAQNMQPVSKNILRMDVW